MSAQVPAHLEVADHVRGQIADGTLKPGQAAPTQKDLSTATGRSQVTCRQALLLLVARGDLVAGESNYARPRVPGQPQGSRRYRP
jgi:DNA-binding GntR family transcriptional regulator